MLAAAEAVAVAANAIVSNNGRRQLFVENSSSSRISGKRAEIVAIDALAGVNVSGIRLTLVAEVELAEVATEEALAVDRRLQPEMRSKQIVRRIKCQQRWQRRLHRKGIVMLEAVVAAVDVLRVIRPVAVISGVISRMRREWTE